MSDELIEPFDSSPASDHILLSTLTSECTTTSDMCVAYSSAQTIATLVARRMCGEKEECDKAAAAASTSATSTAQSAWSIPNVLEHFGLTANSASPLITVSSSSTTNRSATVTAAVCFLTHLQRQLYPSTSATSESAASEIESNTQTANIAAQQQYLTVVISFLTPIATIATCAMNTSDPQQYEPAIAQRTEVLQYLQDFARLLLNTTNETNEVSQKFITVLAPLLKNFLHLDLSIASLEDAADLRNLGYSILLGYFQIYLRFDTPRFSAASADHAEILKVVLEIENHNGATGHSEEMIEQEEEGRTDNEAAETDSDNERALWLLRIILLRLCLTSSPSAIPTSPSSFGSILSLLYNRMHLSQQTPHEFRCYLFELMSEDDDALLESLLHLLHVWKAIATQNGIDQAAPSSAPSSSSSPPSSSAPHLTVILTTLHPYSLFHHFISLTLMNDHTVLLDFLVTNESTVFLEYLCQVLKMLTMETTIDDGASQIESLEEVCKVEPSDSTSSSDSAFDSLLSCLIRLSFSLTRLVEKNLFPYPIVTLLKLLREMELAYERHGGGGGEEDAGEEEEEGKD